VAEKLPEMFLMGVARGAHRFSEILASVPGLSARMLAQRLRELEAAGLVGRQVAPTMPVQVTYQLTPAGRELMASLQPLVHWGLRWHGQQDQQRGASLPAPIPIVRACAAAWAA